MLPVLPSYTGGKTSLLIPFSKFPKEEGMALLEYWYEACELIVKNILDAVSVGSSSVKIDLGVISGTQRDIVGKMLSLCGYTAIPQVGNKGNAILIISWPPDLTLKK